jgi:hypothetical protein
MLEDKISDGSGEDSLGIMIGSSTDETSEWRIDEISYSSSSICDIIVDKRHAMIDKSSRLFSGFREQAKKNFIQWL